MIGSVGHSLTLDGNTVVVFVTATALAFRAAGQPVAGVDLYCRLGGFHLKHTTALGRLKHSYLRQVVLVPVVDNPAVVISFP